MSEASRKVIILNKLSSPYISEAIIILKNGAILEQSRAVEEAERIVRDYLKRQPIKNGQPRQGTARSHTWKLTAVLCAAAAVLSFFSAILIFR